MNWGLLLRSSSFRRRRIIFEHRLVRPEFLTVLGDVPGRWRHISMSDSSVVCMLFSFLLRYLLKPLQRVKMVKDRFSFRLGQRLVRPKESGRGRWTRQRPSV